MSMLQTIRVNAISISPGYYMKDEVVIGITASGLDHSRAKKVRLAIQEAMEASDDTDNSEE